MSIDRKFLRERFDWLIWFWFDLILRFYEKRYSAFNNRLVLAYYWRPNTSSHKEKTQRLITTLSSRRVGDFRLILTISPGFFTMFVFTDVTMFKINLGSTYAIGTITFVRARVLLRTRNPRAREAGALNHWVYHK